MGPRRHCLLLSSSFSLRCQRLGELSAVTAGCKWFRLKSIFYSSVSRQRLSLCVGVGGRVRSCVQFVLESSSPDGNHLAYAMSPPIQTLIVPSLHLIYLTTPSLQVNLFTIPFTHIITSPSFVTPLQMKTPPRKWEYFSYPTFLSFVVLSFIQYLLLLSMSFFT